MERMDYIPRTIEPALKHALARGKSVLLLGPRQTGKTTLVERMQADLSVSFVGTATRLRYEKNPSLLEGELKQLKIKPGQRPLVVLDEVQKVPLIMDVVQDLIDRKQGQFILTGSSARKLRHGPHVNLLPGRVVALRLDPYDFSESPDRPLEDRLTYGDLPGILNVEKNKDQETDLQSYVGTYLEQEVRAEALVRQLASFARFLELAASESGLVVNFRKLSQEIGVAHTTVAGYYQILEDCLISERIDPFTRSAHRKKLTRAVKHVFFDLGVRRAAAGESAHPTRERWGHLFEQWVGLQLLRRLRTAGGRLRFWRDLNGPEVDWLIERDDELVPIEVKWADSPRPQDARHLQVFLSEYPEAKRAYIVCRTPRPLQLAPRVVAIPWHDLAQV